MSTHIRSMSLRTDILAVSHIEQASFPIPWTASQIADEINRRNGWTGALVAEYAGHVVGFVLYRLVAKRVQLKRIAVLEGHRRCGIGTSLMGAIVELNKDRRESIVSFVDEYDLPLQLYLRSCGFRWVSTIPGKYLYGRDKYRMVRDISSRPRIVQPLAEART